MLMMAVASVSSVMIMNEWRDLKNYCLSYSTSNVVMTAECNSNDPTQTKWIISQVAKDDQGKKYSSMICVDGKNVCYGHKTSPDPKKPFAKLFIKDITSPFQHWTNTSSLPKNFINDGTKLCDGLPSSLSGIIRSFGCDNKPIQQWNIIYSI